MMRRILALAALALSLFASPASPQNVTCPDRPPGDSTFFCANTRFVTASGGSNCTTLGAFSVGLGGGLSQCSNVGSSIATINGGPIGSVSTDGLILQNPTAAAAGAQQWSPRLHWSGFGWKTNATAASQQMDAIVELQIYQDAVQPDGFLVTSFQVNGGGYLPVQSINVDGNSNTQVQVLAPASKNANFVWVDNLAKVWYLQNTGGASDTLSLINSDANSNTTLLSMTQAGTLSLSPGALSPTRALNVTQSGPASGSLSGPFSFNLVNITSYGGNTSGSGGSDSFGLLNSNAAALRVNYAVSGANGQGQEAGLFALRQQASGQTGDMTGAVGSVYGNLTQTSGAMFGLVGFALIDTGYSGTGAYGIELDVGTTSGVNPTRRIGVSITNTKNGVAATLDAAILAASNTAGGEWKNIISLSKLYGQFPTASTSTFLSADTAATPINHILDLTNFTISGNIINAPNVSIAPSGLITSLGANIGAVSTDRLVLENLTAAANNAQQWSPRAHWIGQVWNTTAAASQALDWIAELQPRQGTSTSLDNVLVFSAQLNAGGYVPVVSFHLSGAVANNSSLNLNAPSGKNANMAYQDGGNNVWYAQNAGATDTYQILNSDANGNVARLVLTQAGALSGPVSVTSPLLIGGSGTTGTQLTFQTTTGNGTTDAFVFKRGNNGATTVATINNSGVMFGSTAPVYFISASANSGTLPSNPAGLGSNIVAAIANVDGAPTRIAMFAAGTGASNSVNYFASRGTIASPTATQSGDILGSNFWYGFGTVYYNGSGIVSTAQETWSSTAGGAALDVYTTPLTTLGINISTRFFPSGGVGVGTLTDPGIGSISANVKFVAAGNNGQTVTTTVRAAGGAADCTLIFTGGIKTGGTC